MHGNNDPCNNVLACEISEVCPGPTPLTRECQREVGDTVSDPAHLVFLRPPPPP